MMLLPLYALLVWYFCFRFRRQWQGWIALLGGLFAILTLVMVDRKVRIWFNLSDNPFSSLQFILWGELFIVAIGGVFILLLPRRTAHMPCRRCGYELAGLEQAHPTCPECGTTQPRPDP